MAEQTPTTEPQKCAHVSCDCTVPAGTKYLQRLLQESPGDRAALQLPAPSLSPVALGRSEAARADRPTCTPQLAA